MIATETRLQAIARLAEIAGHPSTDPRLVLSRPNAIDFLYRQALRASIGEETQLDEVRALYDVARGRTTPLVDAVLGDGLPDETRTRLTPETFQEAVAVAWRN